MIHYNILSTCLIFIVFCSLFVVAPSEKKATCYSEMEKYFGNVETPMIECIRNAVRKLTKDDTQMHKDVSSYYEKFLFKVKEDSIFLPSIFCEQAVKDIHEALSASEVMAIIKSCVDQLQVFLDADPQYYSPADADPQKHPTGGPYDVFSIVLYNYKLEEDELDEVHSDSNQEEEESDEDHLDYTLRNLYLIRVSETIEEDASACNQTPKEYCDEIHAAESN